MNARPESNTSPRSDAPIDLLARLAHSDRSAGEARRVQVATAPSWALLALAIAVSVGASSLLTYILIGKTAPAVAADANATPPLAGSAAMPGSAAIAADPGVSLEASGYVVARNKASVSSDITGRVQSIRVVVGQKVKKGDVIAELDDREARLRLTAAELMISQNRLAAQNARVTLGLERDKVAQMKGLREQKFVSNSMYDQASASHESAQIQVEAADVTMADGENSLRAARIFVERHVIRAPFDGVVVEVSARPGETVSPTSSGNSFIRTGIVQLVDPVSLYVVAEVPERQVQPIQVGQPVDIVGKAVGGAIFPSKVAWVAPVSNRQRGVVEVGIDLTDQSRRFIDGMEVDVRFKNRIDAMQDRRKY